MTVRPHAEQRTSFAIPLALPPKRSRRAWLVKSGLALVVIAGALGGYLVWRNHVTPVAQVATVVVRQGDIEDTVSALGNLQPLEYVDVGTQVSGQLKRIHFEIGDTVKQGELVAEIDPVVQDSRVEADHAQLLALQAELADKQAQLKLSDLQYKRQKRLAKESATSDDAVQIAEATMRSAAAQVDALKAQIQQTRSTLEGDEATLGFTKIYAPMTGTVVSISARQGQTLNANQQAPIILRVADLTTMTVWTQVSEADVSRLRIGMDAYFATLGAPERRWHGTLKQILPTPEIVNNVVLYTALFDVANPKLELLSQMTAQVFFVVAAAENAVLVPLAALKPIDEKAGRYNATVVDADGTASLRELQVVVKTRTMAEVVSGLRAGERVSVTSRPTGSTGNAGGGTRNNGAGGLGGSLTPRLGP